VEEDVVRMLEVGLERGEVRSLFGLSGKELCVLEWKGKERRRRRKVDSMMRVGEKEMEMWMEEWS
jgi:hypothetical protein